jgi:prepilin-type N-terminal cleavage/methylation domain-containing protein
MGLTANRAEQERMRTFQAGILKKTDGFTLLELIFVAFLLSIALTFVSVRWNVFSKQSKDTLLEKLSIEIALLRENSISEYRQKAIELDVTMNTIRIGEVDLIKGFVSEREILMPAKYLLKDAVINGEKFSIGKTVMRLYPTGIVDKVILHFESEKEGFFSITINPLTARVSEENGYIEEIKIPVTGRVNPT